jgi:uncharacterized protein (DUF362 family)
MVRSGNVPHTKLAKHSGACLECATMPRESTRLLAPFSRPASRVAIRRVGTYQEDLASVLYETLREFDLPVRGKTVLLKPNLVGFDPLGTTNTHPAVIAAARETFSRLGAAVVLIGDGPATERDTQAVLESMRLREFAGPLTGFFVDLNLDDVERVVLKTHASRLKELYLPKTVRGVDFLVSLPKMKTHHWAGVTLSLKNMFGVVPGGCYGWPKNILHWAGIDRAILDINAAARPDFAIVDGIIGMEGNGPLQGTPKACGVLVLGDDPVAVDSTCARVMGLVPEKIKYLAGAATLLGHIESAKIHQLGENIDCVRTPFAVLKEFKHLRSSGKA